MMDSHDKALEFTGSLPFAVSAVASIPAAADLLVINQGNEQVMRSVMMLDPNDESHGTDCLRRTHGPGCRA